MFNTREIVKLTVQIILIAIGIAFIPLITVLVWMYGFTILGIVSGADTGSSKVLMLLWIIGFVGLSITLLFIKMWMKPINYVVKQIKHVVAQKRLYRGIDAGYENFNDNNYYNQGFSSPYVSKDERS